VPPPVGVTTHHVESAAQLQWALGNAAKGADVIVMTAAVADYRPAREAKEKLKRGELGNPDLLAELGKQRKGSTPLLVRVRGRDRGRARERAREARREALRSDRRE